MNGLSIIFIVFVVMLVLRVPIAYCLGLSGMAYIAMTGNFDMTSFASVMVRSVDSFPLMAVPFFILAGALMTAGGISKQIVQFATALVGRLWWRWWPARFSRLCPAPASRPPRPLAPS